MVLAEKWPPPPSSTSSPCRLAAHRHARAAVPAHHVVLQPALAAGAHADAAAPAIGHGVANHVWVRPVRDDEPVAGSAADGVLLDEPLGVVSEEDGAGAAAAADGVEAERDGRRAGLVGERAG